MDIQIKGCAYIRVAEQGTQGLVVTIRLHTSGGKSMPEDMNPPSRQSQDLGNPFEIVPEGLGIGRGGFPGSYVGGIVPPFPELYKDLAKYSGDRNITEGGGRLWGSYHQFRSPVRAIGMINPINSP